MQSNLYSFLLLICLKMVHGCQNFTCVWLEFYHCKLCYQNCGDYAYSGCFQTTCPGNLSDSSSKNQCGGEKLIDIGWNQCISYCCSNSLSNSPFALQVVNECKIKNQKMKIVTIVIISLIGFVIIIFFMLFCFTKKFQKPRQKLFTSLRKNCPKCCKCFQKKKLQKLAYSQSTMEPASINNEIFWETDIENSKNFIFEAFCQICHQKQTNFVIKCFHNFHVNCLINQFAKNIQCPICKDIQILPARIFCLKCKTKYWNLSLDNLKGNFQSLKKDASLICPQCHLNSH